MGHSRCAVYIVGVSGDEVEEEEEKEEDKEEDMEEGGV